MKERRFAAHFNRLKSRELKGFTLIELIIVIAIIGILIAIAIPVYSNWRDNANAAPMKSDLRHAAEQMEVLKSNEGTYPTAMPGSIASSQNVELTLLGDPALSLPAMYSQYKLPGAGMAPTATDHLIRAGSYRSDYNQIPMYVNYTVNTQKNPDGTSGRINFEAHCTRPLATSHCVAQSLGLSTTSIAFGGTAVHRALCESESSRGTYRLVTFSTSIGQVPNRPSTSPQTWTGQLGPDYLCNSGERLVAVAKSHASYFPIAWGKFADQAPLDSSTYCIEATSSKTSQIWSWRGRGGLTEGPC